MPSRIPLVPGKAPSGMRLVPDVMKQPVFVNCHQFEVIVKVVDLGHFLMLAETDFKAELTDHSVHPKRPPTVSTAPHIPNAPLLKSSLSLITG